MKVTGAVILRSRDSESLRSGGVHLFQTVVGTPTAVLCFPLAVVVPGIPIHGVEYSLFFITKPACRLEYFIKCPRASENTSNLLCALKG